jgi:prepilin-type N-terminal cleavage/methylation domain-containing protein
MCYNQNKVKGLDIVNNIKSLKVLIKYLSKYSQMKTNKQINKGFTLIELLVVIAIIAILMVTVIVTINPGQLLAQARDSNRLSDLNTINTAINMFITDTGGKSGIMGTSGITYLSLIDPTATTTAGTDCTNLGFTSGYFHCPASSTVQKSDGTGWIPINFTQISSGNPLTQIPIDPINTSSSDEYYAYATNGTTYTITASPEAIKNIPNIANYRKGNSLVLQGGFPQGWIPVPGNPQFGTHNFYVMQYDAKCSDNQGNPLSTNDTGYQTYSNSNANAACTSANNLSVVSTPNGYPIANISEPTAKTYCASLGGHLMTNDEWMTIAYNASAQGSNWSGGSVGNGYMPRGNSDGSYAQSDNSQYGYLPSSTSTYYSDFTHLRTMNLSNNSVIWDFVGNIYQEVQRSTMNQGDNTNTMTTPTCSSGTLGTWETCQYGNLRTPYITTYNDSSFSAATIGPPNSSWNTNQNMGSVQTNDGGTGGNAFIRGGDCSFVGAYAGLFALRLDWSISTYYPSLGFRCTR